MRGYHHNLETSATHFPKMCTTHAYQEDVNAVRAGLDAGLYVCSGGIFGIGETWDDRVELGPASWASWACLRCRSIS